MTAAPGLSVVVPAYNEADTIGRTLREAAAYLADQGMSHEFVVVDDGSQDRTAEAARALVAQLPAVRVIAAPHRGKGAAVRDGMLAASGGYRLFMDADHSTHIRELAKCLPWLREGYDVVIGSRKMPGAAVTVRQPPLREAMGKVFTMLTNVLVAPGITDITCGFKCFTASAAREVFSRQRMDGWGFDAEILFITQHLGLRLKEVPVVWADDASTKVHLVRDALRSLGELATIRAGAWAGRYGRRGERPPVPVD